MASFGAGVLIGEIAALTLSLTLSLSLTLTVKELRGAALIDPSLLLRFSRAGVDPTALRVARTLLRPDDARPTRG